MWPPLPQTTPFSSLSGFRYNERSNRRDESSPVYRVTLLPQVPPIRKVKLQKKGSKDGPQNTKDAPSRQILVAVLSFLFGFGFSFFELSFRALSIARSPLKYPRARTWDSFSGKNQALLIPTCCRERRIYQTTSEPEINLLSAHMGDGLEAKGQTHCYLFHNTAFTWK